MIIKYNGSRVTDEGGYWVDRHGHQAFACRGQLLPACPLYPFMNTMWRLTRAAGCMRRLPKAA